MTASIAFKGIVYSGKKMYDDNINSPAKDRSPHVL
jgi:hypothetical protein